VTAAGRTLRILITNDDGVDAPGISIMRGIAAELSDDVWVVAPDANQSGVGHRFTLGRELSLSEREPKVFAVNGGSPADSVVVGITHILRDKRPDLVLSGVNNGQNLGDIFHCSGTAAGAREGALHGAIGIGLSQGVDYANSRDVKWDVSLRFGAEIVRGILREAAGRDTYYNVNFPFCPPQDVSGVRVVPHQRFAKAVFSYYASDNAGKFFVAIPETPMPLDTGSDFHVLHHDKAITVTPLTLLQTDMATAERLQGRLGLGAAPR
jgi:5'-nucleotidase